MNYDQKITLEQALDLQNRYPELLIYSGSGIPFEIRDFYCTTHYDLGECIYLTRSDFATFIQGNKPLPDVSGGYGYANKPFGNGTYEGIGNWYQKALNGDWHFVSGEFSDRAEFNTNFWEYCFQLTDLARVEAEADPKPSMQHNEPYDVCIWYHDAHNIQEAIKKGTHQDILVVLNTNALGTPFYISSKNINQLYGEHGQERYLLTTKSQYGKTVPKPSMPAHFTYQNDEWLREANKLAVEHEELKAKYSELEEQHNTLIKHLQEATASADAKQDIINNLEDKNKKLKFRLDDLHGYSPKDLKIAELEMQVDFNKDMRKMHLENVSDLHDFYHKIIWNLFGQLEK